MWTFFCVLEFFFLLWNHHLFRVISISIFDSVEIRASQVELVKPAKCSESSKPAHIRHREIEFSRNLMTIS